MIVTNRDYHCHCRGISITDKLAFQLLLGPNENLHKLFPYGYRGAVNIALKSYRQTSWKDTDFMGNIKVKLVAYRYFSPKFHPVLVGVQYKKVWFSLVDNGCLIGGAKLTYVHAGACKTQVWIVSGIYNERFSNFNLHPRD